MTCQPFIVQQTDSTAPSRRHADGHCKVTGKQKHPLSLSLASGSFHRLTDYMELSPS
jgi:hypothetical protein